MNPEADQPGTGVPSPVQETAVEPGAAAAERPAASRTAAAAKAAPKRKAGVPVWRTGKPDAFLAAAVDVARTAIEGITTASAIGPHLAAKSEGDRLVTHLFESRLPGYAGWQWYAVLTRNSRSKLVTVNELGLLPSEDSILAPEWVPWAERVRPEDAQDEEREQEPGKGPGPEESAQAAEPEPSGPEEEQEPEAELEAAAPGQEQSVQEQDEAGHAGPAGADPAGAGPAGGREG